MRGEGLISQEIVQGLSLLKKILTLGRKEGGRVLLVGGFAKQRQRWRIVTKCVREVSGAIIRNIFHDLVGEADKFAVIVWVSLLDYLNRLWEIRAKRFSEHNNCIYWVPSTLQHYRYHFYLIHSTTLFWAALPSFYFIDEETQAETR